MSDPKTNEVPFICTGNYYRSRFAEAVFNHLAEERGLPWKAFSRGVAIHLVEGTLSPHTALALHRRGISLRHTGSDRCSLTETDLSRARRTIALKETEHRPYIARLFPAWEERIEYWSFHDLDVLTSDEVLPEIEVRVLQLIASL